MSEQNTISAFYEQDHDRLDDLFKTFQQFKRSDVAKAKEAFQGFKLGLQRHIVWEEDLLFPLWEEKNRHVRRRADLCDAGRTPPDRTTG